MTITRAKSGWVLLLVCLLITSVTITPWAQDDAKAEDKKEEKKEKKKKKDLPLEPTRKIEFTTDEATWLSLDVSPDGKTIVFELLGDLYTLPIDGGEATRITEGLGYDSQPVYSPDGMWIAFISDRDGADNLWVVKADGTEPKKLTKERSLNTVQSPAWMPDSRYVLVSQSGKTGLHVRMYHILGGTGVSVTGSKKPPSPGAGGPPARGRLPRFMGVTASSDGHFLYYTRQTPDRGGFYTRSDFTWQVERRDLRTGDTNILTQGRGGALRPVLSPDGNKLIYATRYETRTGLRIRNLETGEDHWLKYPVQRDNMESGRGSRDMYPGFAFTPDGRDIVVTYGGKIHRVNVDSGDAREIPFTANVALELGPLLNFPRRVDEGPVRSRLIMDARQSPDGKTIAFSSMARLYVMDLAEGKPRQLTPDSVWAFKPAWSPDGRWVAYVTWDYDGNGHLWKTRSDGSGQPQRLTNIPSFYTDPVFSPDGSRLVARRGNAWIRSQTFSEFGGLRIRLDLIWLSAEGGKVNLITLARGLGSPHFSQENDRVYFYSREGLVSMRYDGTDRRTHLKVTGRPTPRSRRPPPAQDAQISPDGRWALARVANQIFVVAVPRVGGNTPSVNVFSPSLPVKQLTDIGADTYAWADGGKTIAWSVGTTFFRRSLESISFQPEKKDKDAAKNKEEGKNSTDKDNDKKPEETPEDKEKDQEPKKAKEEEEAVESFEVVLEFPRHKPEGTVVLRGATVITMKGDEIIRNADIVVTGNRIAAVGRRGSVQIPSGARRIDLRGKTIVPGFVDTHAHYEMRTMGVLELHNWSFLANLAYGVTTGLDVQTSTNDYLAYLDLVQAGRMAGPRAYSTGPGVFSTNDFRSADAAYRVLEKYKKYYRNDNLKSYVAGNRKQRQWVVQAAKKLELTVTTEGARDLRLDTTHAIDGFGGNEHTLPIVPLYKDVVELFARSRTAYTPTLLVLYGGPAAESYFYSRTEVHDDQKLNRFTPHNVIDAHTRRRRWYRDDEHSFPKSAAQAAKIQRSGGLIGVGAHGQLQGLGYHWEMWALSMGGLTPMEVLRAATLHGAEIIGLAQDLGSIEAGKLADMVILDRTPIDDIHNTNTVRYVMKNGELFEGDTLKQIWPVEKELEPFWWWNSAPTDHTTQP